jgi:predicted nucleic acid-binding protein
VDTSFLYALIDDGDPGHAQVSSLYQEYGGTFLLSRYVLAETISLITKRFAKHHGMAAGRWIQESRRTTILHPDEDDFQAAWALFMERPESDFDLVDALSFRAMQTNGLDTAFSRDAHFAQMGFTV